MSNPLIVTSSIVVHNTPAMRMASSARTCRQLMSLGRILRVSSVQSIAARTYGSIAGNSNILKLHERGIFQTVYPEESSPDLHRALISNPQCIYCGFDPTAPSLHIGNLLGIIALLHCQRGGHNVIALLGGATAQIGDPSGRTTERAPLSALDISKNVRSIRNSLDRIFTNHELHFWDGRKHLPPIQILDNADWYHDRNVVEFLSSVGRHFRMGTMLLKQSVQSRLQSTDGMSFSEFSYQVFQSYDWLHLLKHNKCMIQIGGNDQTGNIVAGAELISRVTDKQVYGLTVPLITNSAGNKLGKTAGNAVWLNPDQTTPFDLYQYFVRLPDDDMERYLKLFTFLSDAAITDLLQAHKKSPEARKAQKKLAENVTLLVHGEDGLSTAKKCTNALYSGKPEALTELSQGELEQLFANAPTTELRLEPGTSVLNTVMSAQCFHREEDADRVIKAGGVSINMQKVKEPEFVLIPGQHILPNGITLIRVGKKNYYIVKWLDFV